MKPETFNKLYDLFLRFNRRLTFIITRLAPPLSLDESHVLAEVELNAGISVVEVAARIGMDKSTTSRFIAALADRDFLKVVQSEEDKRVKKIMLTQQGRDILRVDNGIRNQQVSECISSLNTKDQSSLRYYLSLMADALGAVPVFGTAEDNAVKIEIRRLTRAFGIIGNQFMGTGFTVHQCQVLHLVFTNGYEMSMQDLRDMLPFEKTTFSRLVSGLADDDLILKVASEFDRRQFNVKLTQKGIAIAQHNLKLGAAVMQTSTQKMSSEDINNFVVILEKFLMQTRRTERVMAEESVSVDILKTPEERKVGRGFLMETLVRLHAHYDVPEEIFPRGSLCYALYIGNSMRAVFEIRKDGNAGEIFNVAVAPEILNSELPLKLISFGLEDASVKHGISSLNSSDKLAVAFLGRYAVRSGNTDRVILDEKSINGLIAAKAA